MNRFSSSFRHVPLIRPEARSFSFPLKRNLSGKESMRILNVAEKNEAAKNIAAFLSSGSARMREGPSKFNKIYEFECEAFGQNNRMVMTSVAGHLLAYEFAGRYRRWKDVNPITLFEAPIERICPVENKNIKANLENEIRSCSKLIIWTDCDREGENIGFEIIEVCKAQKPNIDVYRAKFSEITQQSVRRALKNLELPNKHMDDAINVRRELDLRIGAAFTRFQTFHLRRAFPTALGENLVSYGSCQFPTLGFVVERFKEISEFIPEKFWEIKVSHTINGLTVNFLWERKRLFEKLACEVLYEKCLESRVAKVDNVESKPRTKWRPRPLDTVELEKVVSRKLRINAKETLRIAEKLYTQGLISYPRTETNSFPKELNLVPFVQCQAEDMQWGDFAQKVLIAGPNPFQGNKTDHAHPPIYPIKHTNNLSGNEKAIYEYIVRHFLACLSNHAEGLETTVQVTIADEKFTATGLMITAKNYLEVYPYEKWTDKELHIYTVGSTFEADVSLAEGETSPPELLTEADLIALMDKHGIGTDATHAEHIETIKARLYVGLQNNKYFVPRTLGMGLVEGYINMGYAMAKPELRAQLEADLKKISENKSSAEEVLTKHLGNYKKVFEGVQLRVKSLSETIQSYFQIDAAPVEPEEVYNFLESPVVKCPKCSSSMFLRTSKAGKRFLGCSNYPACREVLWFPSSVLDASVTSDSCATCGPETRLVKFKFERGSSYLPSSYVGCLSCDVSLLEVLNSNKWTHRSQRGTALGEINDSGFSSLNESSPGGSTFEESSPPNCHCGMPTVRLRVSKSEANLGRTFYKCSAPKESQCDFFQWENEAEDNSRRNLQRSSKRNPDPVDGDVLHCYCARPCRRLTAAKEGPNKGKDFYTCGKSPRDKDRCQFFKWVDNDENKPAEGSANLSFRDTRQAIGAETFESRSKKATGRKTQRKTCGICGQEGHYRNSCPRGRP